MNRQTQICFEPVRRRNVFSLPSALRFAVVAAALACAGYGQTLINLGTQSRNINFTGAQSTSPVQTGTALPATCSQGQMFLNTAATPGQNLYVCTSTNVWSLESGAAPSGGYQTMLGNATALPQEPNLNFSSSFSLLDNPGSSRTDLGLASVNSNVGTFGSATQVPVLTVNAFGQVTAVSTAAVSGGSGSGIASGTLASMPITCTAGAIYFATDQPAGQQLFTCSSANVWTQMLSLGGSGALQVTNGSLDINTVVVPQLGVANTFTGLNTMTNGLSLLTSNTQPACSASIRGTLWYLNNGSAKDSVQACVYTGSAFAWVSLY
ncbi:MAG: hypothetical protein ACRD4O_07355 [Bryobacteraceae bacterium]